MAEGGECMSPKFGADWDWASLFVVPKWLVNSSVLVLEMILFLLSPSLVTSNFQVMEVGVLEVT